MQLSNTCLQNSLQVGQVLRAAGILAGQLPGVWTLGRHQQASLIQLLHHPPLHLRMLGHKVPASALTIVVIQLQAFQRSTWGLYAP